MAGLVGHGAVAKTNTLTVQGAPAPPVTLQEHLPTNANSVKVQITDSSGAIVRTIDLGARNAGDVDTNWLGLDDKGRPLAPGNYGVKVVATGAGNSTVDGYAQITGTVTAVDFGSGSTQLRVGGSPVGPSDIVSVQK
jgi:flagellar basal-body rod modification protein FlgD